MSGEQSADLDTLQAQRYKHQAALSGVSEKIAKIEESARLKREAEERRQLELARFQKKLKVCREVISWIEGKLAELKKMAEGQEALALEQEGSAFFILKDTLQELQEWTRTLTVFKERVPLLQKEISTLEASA